MHSCVPSKISEVSYGHSCGSRPIIVARGRVIIIVIHLISFVIHVNVGGVVIVVILRDVKEGSEVSDQQVQSTWVATRQPVYPVDYFLRKRQRFEVLEI